MGPEGRQELIIHFASFALAGLVANPGNEVEFVTPAKFAKAAFDIAEAMVAEREERCAR